MFNIGPAELIVILLVALLIVGPKRLPEVGKSVGKALREIRKQTDEVRSSFEATINPDFDDDEDDGHGPVDRTGSETPVTEWGGEDDATGDDDAPGEDDTPAEDAPAAPEPDPQPAALDPVEPSTSRRRRRASQPSGDDPAGDGA